MAECTIYDKLRYIAETKDLIKAAIEAQNVEVLESATFRQYAEYITEIRKVSSVNGMQGDVTITAKDLGALTEIPSEYITETELNEKGYLTAVPDVYITEDELSSQLADKVSQNGLNEAIDGVRNDIPTNVSQLTNDSGYITLNEVPKVDLSGYALKSEIPDISVKQDKLTAGNGISITDNVISLDYEYDLFEVVQSLPTENISDNKVYLVLDSNGNEGNTYLEYLYVDGHWEELGKFKANVDLSGYATEEWVNGQGFLKEHQDISNLATKAELNTKQDTISDLDTIRSGAALGATALQSVPSEYATEQWVNGQGFLKEHQDISNLATKEELNTKQDTITDLEAIRSGAAKGSTALQSVPSTYALKTDILSAKTDTRYTTYDVQNPVLSGKTILLQNEVTDSRKYHTLGFDKTVETTEIGQVQKYVDFNREFDSSGFPIIRTNFDNYENIPLDFSNITDDGDVYIIYYYGSFINMDNGSEGEQLYAYITYNKNTKILKASDGAHMSLLQFTRSDTREYIFNEGNTQYDCSQLPDGAYLIWHIYVHTNLYYRFSASTAGKLFVGETTVNANTSSMPDRKNEYFRYENDVKAYILTDKNTTFKTINGEQITGNGNIEVAANVDLTPYATKEELNTKQDTISDLETIRSGAAKGATALQEVPDTYATEQWVNEQGFLKEHQDISNLATKTELNAKQDTISDLEAIRSGASKGETALQSVPEEYAKKTDIPDISTKQDVITDLETIRSGAALGATALQSVPDTYATEEWVNTQGFLKEHQDISNLATKDELNEKQNAISDLDSIRSGAAKGATALQSVPDTYALKSDILSAKTDERYTDYDVQNPVLSGNTIVLQNEVTDSRKYHTLGYDKTAETTEIGQVIKYSRFNGEFDENGSPIIDTNFDNNQNIPLDFSHITDDGDQIIIHYTGSFANVDYETGTRTEGDSFEATITYNRNTKQLNASDDANITIYHFTRSDTSEYIFNPNNKEFNCYMLPDDAYLIWSIGNMSSNLYYRYNVSTQGKLFVGETTTTTQTSRLPQNKNEFFRYENDVKAYILTDKNTTFKTINGKQITGNGNIELATKDELNEKQNVIPDLYSIRIGAEKGATALQSVPSGYATEQWVNSQGFLKEHQDISNLATKEELNTKQDTITDLEAIRSGAEKGATALQSVPSTYALKTDIPDISVKQDKLTAGNGISITDNIISLDYEYDLFEVVPSLPTENISDNKIYLVYQSDGDGNNLYIEYIYASGHWEELGKFKANVDLSGYATEQWVNSQGFLKEHQDISNLATKAELNAKQDVITDLETIRSGAEKGATALQSVPSEYAKKTDIPDISTKQDVITDLESIRSGAALGSTALQSVPNTYALKSEIPDISVKQDTLVSGTNIKTINGESILGSGNITIQGGGNVDLSDYYTKTETNELVNPKLEQITLTQAEYDALSTKEDNVLYIISDAEDLKFKTINGQQILGEGNIVIESSADNVPTVQTTVEGTTNNYVYSSGKDNRYGVISDISTSISYSTDKATVSSHQYYWGSNSNYGYDAWSINAATNSQAGLMSSSDKSKLDGIDLTTKQDTLVSGTNIKTVNGISLLGEGDITVSGEGVVDLSGYYTKAEIDAMIGGASETITQINNLVV